MFRRLLACFAVAAFGACSTGSPSLTTEQAVKVPRPSNSFTTFETLQTRPLALSPSGNLLFALNTPDNRLEVFHIGPVGNLEPRASIVVGLEPIAVAARSETEVWVVNHLSDSVSIVNVAANGTSGHVVRTLLVGDEPRDIVFAANKSRAFITTAHRGQNDPDANQDIVLDYKRASSAGGRADVWVFDTGNLGTSLGGDRFAKLTLFADTPRALAVSADGNTVYAAAFFSGNMTTTVSTDAVRHVYATRVDPSGNLINWPGLPPTAYQPLTGLVVKGRAGTDGTVHWTDAYGTNFDAYVNLTLLDLDVFAINATADAATMQKNVVPYAGVGTTLFNMAVNPVNGKVYVSNTDARNDQRFEGPVGAVTAHAVDSRISVIDPTTHAVTVDNLNAHLPGGDPKLSRAFPQDLVTSSDGKKLYVVAQGSAKLAVYNTADLENGTAMPTAGNQVLLSKGGPTGVAVDEAHGRAFVLTRFDNGISTVDLHAMAEARHITMYNPEPANVTQGRQYLYDATLTSAAGDQACASCHIGGDLDGLAWDLGNPAGSPLPITHLAAADVVLFTIPPAFLYPLIGQPVIDALFAAYQPLKGPMTTQSLRGMDNHGGMHWRGDRNGAVQQSGTPFLDGSGNPVVSAQPSTGIFDEEKAFESFNVAFQGLVGRSAPLTDEQMAEFTHFILDVSYPPNPIRNFDDSLTADQQAGHDFFFNNVMGQELPSDRFHNCNGCHTLDPNGNAQYGVKHPGFFGTDGRISFENETQVFKVPQLRNLYQKVGRYSSSPDAIEPLTVAAGFPTMMPDGTIAIPQTGGPLTNPSMTSVRGFGFNHDGINGDLEQFFMGAVFIQQPTNAPAVLGRTIAPNPYGIPSVWFNADGSELFLDNTTHGPTTAAVNPANNQPNIPVLDSRGFKVRHDIVSFMMAFDTNLKPIVGQQATLTPANQSQADVLGRVALLEAQAQATTRHADLVVKGVVDGIATGFTFDATRNLFVADRSKLGTLSDAQLRALVGPHTDALTFTAVPLGSGWRIGVDRNGDGNSDGN